MSFNALAWALNASDISSTEKFVLIVLADCLNQKTGQCNPSYVVISRKTGFNKSTVRKAVRALEGSGKLKITGSIRDDGSQGSNNYKLMITGSDPQPRGTCAEKARGVGPDSRQEPGIINKNLEPNIAGKDSQQFVGFNEFMKAYPIRKRQPSCRHKSIKAYRAVLEWIDHQTLIEAAKDYRKTLKDDAWLYAQKAETWLNEGSWIDHLTPRLNRDHYWDTLPIPFVKLEEAS